MGPNLEFGGGQPARQRGQTGLRNSESVVARRMCADRDTINESIHSSFAEQLALEMRHQAVLIPKNMQEGARAFVEKRRPKFDGSRMQ